MRRTGGSGWSRLCRVDRRRALGIVTAGVAFAGSFGVAAPGRTQPSIVADVERYLNSITTLEARFQQIAPDGGLATGKLYLQRPGRLRFDYDPPSRIRLVAPGDWRLIFYDASIKQVNVIPIGQTPLGILLDREISLDDTVEVVDVQHAGEEVALTVVREGNADQGAVTLVFAEQPMALRRWSVTDAQGLETHILLDEVQTGGTIDPELFRWRDPKIFGLPD
jgi:outer membrane lipoprotein-sorting protein